MSKKEVEKNEEGLFNKWLKETDDIVAQWQADSPSGCPATPPQDGESEGKTAHGMPRSTTYFERNLEVWRQLYVRECVQPPMMLTIHHRWRVTEISQILLVLLDSRCPPLHFPPSLSTYLSSHKLILVLTKVDITGPARAAAWTAYLHQRYPGVRIVQVESYVMKEPTESSQSRRVYEPSLPMAFRENFVAALKATHEEMLFPSVDDTVGPKSKALKLRLKREIDWGQVLKTGEASVGDVVGAVASSKGWEDADEDEDVEPEFLTVGVIGQPNVGKSSLLNALFGTHKVRASKTPGKVRLSPFNGPPLRSNQV
jgi:ribosome biogenesis GTPase A